jgi:transketolase
LIERLESFAMSEPEHLAQVMVERFIHAVNDGIDLVPVVADSTSTAKIKPFVDAFPGRLLNVGIAEQTMVGVAAGLAAGGKVAVTCNAAPFLVSRANEQIKIDVCYNNLNVKMFGLNAGASYGPLASTHHAMDDVSIMRGFGNVQIYAPACPVEARQIIDLVLRSDKPTYVRLDGKSLPALHEDHYVFSAGSIDVLREGSNLAFVAAGSTVHEAVGASDTLRQAGVRAAVVSLPSIRPLDRNALARSLSQHSQVVSVEEHNINGGIGSLVAETLAENGIGARLLRLGVEDGGYAIAGDRASTRQALGIDSQSLVATARRLLA